MYEHAMSIFRRSGCALNQLNIDPHHEGSLLSVSTRRLSLSVLMS